MLLSKEKDTKIIEESIVIKKNADKYWKKIFKLYIEKKVGVEILCSAMGLSNTFDKEIIEKYGMKTFIRSYEYSK